jgi:hypothetical protein
MPEASARSPVPRQAMRAVIGEARRAYALLAPRLLRAGGRADRGALDVVFVALQWGQYSLLLAARARWPQDQEIGAALEEARRAVHRSAAALGLLRSPRGHLAPLARSGADRELQKIFSTPTRISARRIGTGPAAWATTGTQLGPGMATRGQGGPLFTCSQGRPEMTTMTEWVRQQLAVRRQAEEEELSRFRQWKAREEKRMRDARAAAPKAPPPPATRGPGWKILENPIIPHTTLEERARAIWAFCWHEADWPGWSVRWGKLDPLLLDLASAAEVCAARSVGEVLGLAVMNHKIILLDEENQRGRPVRDVVKTIVHELCHVTVRNTVHGPQFQRALESAMT